LQVNSSIGIVDYIPTSHFSVQVDSAKVVSNGTVPPDDVAFLVDTLSWKIDKSLITKSQLMILDLLAHNNWERPVYFSTTAGETSYLGLNEFLRLEGMAYRLVPVKKPIADNTIGQINSGILYKRLMETFRFGNMEKPEVYLDETNRRMVTNLRTNFGRLAMQLAEEGKYSEAIAVCDRCVGMAPDATYRFDFFMLPVAETYFTAGANDKGTRLLERLLALYSQDLNYYFRFPGERINQFDYEMQQALSVINHIRQIAMTNNNSTLKNKAETELKKQYDRYVQATGKM